MLIEHKWSEICKDKHRLWSLPLGSIHNMMDEACDRIRKLQSQNEVHAADPREGFPACDLDVDPGWIHHNSWSTVLDQVTCEGCLKIINEKGSN